VWGDTPRPGIDRWAWLHGLTPGIGGLRRDHRVLGVAKERRPPGEERLGLAGLGRGSGSGTRVRAGV